MAARRKRAIGSRRNCYRSSLAAKSKVAKRGPFACALACVVQRDIPRAERRRRLLDRFQLNRICARDEMTQRGIAADSYRITGRLGALSALNCALIVCAAAYRYGGRAGHQKVRSNDVCTVKSCCFARELPQGSLNSPAIDQGRMTNNSDS